MTDTTRNGRKLPAWAERWGKVAALVVVSGALGGTLRDCVGVGAGVAGIQTVAKASTEHGELESAHESIRGEVKALDEDVDARIGAVKKQVGDRFDKADLLTIELFKAVAPNGYENYKRKRRRGRDR